MKSQGLSFLSRQTRVFTPSSVMKLGRCCRQNIEPVFPEISNIWSAVVVIIMKQSRHAQVLLHVYSLLIKSCLFSACRFFFYFNSVSVHWRALRKPNFSFCRSSQMLLGNESAAFYKNLKYKSANQSLCWQIYGRHKIMLEEIKCEAVISKVRVHII